MTFQFQCPSGHLLEGDPTQAHQQCHCPVCGILFIIPPPTGFAAPPAVHETAGSSPPGHPLEVFTPAAAPPAPPPAETAPRHSAPPAAPRIFHIPCPNGHELDAPAEMLEQEVLCPHCNVQFRLREKDSVEYKRKKELEREQREHRIGKLWMNWAIAVALLVLVALIALVLASSG